MRFAEALGISFRAGSGRKAPEGETDRVEEVEWSAAATGLVILILVQAGLVAWTFWEFGSVYSINLALLAFAGLLAPFVVFAIAARVTGTVNRLPAAVLYFSITLAALQLVTSVMSYFGVSVSGFLLGLLAALVYLTPKQILNLKWPVALLVAVLAFLAFLLPGFVAVAVSQAR